MQRGKSAITACYDLAGSLVGFVTGVWLTFVAALRTVCSFKVLLWTVRSSVVLWIVKRSLQ